MANLNKVLLIGNLTRDPELKYLPNQTAVCDFGLAVNRTWTGQDGTKKEETTFVDCSCFGKTAEILSKYKKKGDPLFVEGHLKLDKWLQLGGHADGGGDLLAVALREAREELGIAVGGFRRPGDVFDKHAFGTIHRCDSGNGSERHAPCTALAQPSRYRRASLQRSGNLTKHFRRKSSHSSTDKKSRPVGGGFLQSVVDDLIKRKLQNMLRRSGSCSGSGVFCVSRRMP